MYLLALSEKYFFHTTAFLSKVINSLYLKEEQSSCFCAKKENINSAAVSSVHVHSRIVWICVRILENTVTGLPLFRNHYFRALLLLLTFQFFNLYLLPGNVYPLMYKAIYLMIYIILNWFANIYYHWALPWGTNFCLHIPFFLLKD